MSKVFSCESVSLLIKISLLDINVMYIFTCSTLRITGEGWDSLVDRHTAHLGCGDTGTAWIQIIMGVVTSCCTIVRLRKKDSRLHQDNV